MMDGGYIMEPVIKNSKEWAEYLQRLKSESLSDKELLERAFDFPLEFEENGFVISP